MKKSMSRTPITTKIRYCMHLRGGGQCWFQTYVYILLPVSGLGWDIDGHFAVGYGEQRRRPADTAACLLEKIT